MTGVGFGYLLPTSCTSGYGRPFEVVSSLPAMYAGTPEGLEAHLAPYIEAGTRHVVVRVAD